MLAAALGDDARSVNISALARAYDVYTCKVWHYFRGRNKWPAEEWILTLIVLGLLHEGRDQFEIYLPKTPELCRAFDRLQGKVKWRRKGGDPERPEPVSPPPDMKLEDV